MNVSKSGVAVAALLMLVGLCFGINARKAYAPPVAAIPASQPTATSDHERAEALRAKEKADADAQSAVIQRPKWSTRMIGRDGLPERHSLVRAQAVDGVTFHSTYDQMRGFQFYLYTRGMAPSFGPNGAVNVKLTFIDKHGKQSGTLVTGVMPDGITGIVFPSQGAITALADGIVKSDMMLVQFDDYGGTPQTFAFDCSSFDARGLLHYVDTHPINAKGVYAQVN